MPTPSATTCAHQPAEQGSDCPGRRAGGFDHCLAHLTPVQLSQVLQQLEPGADFDASGTLISAELLAQIFLALNTENERPCFRHASFVNAKFLDSVVFADAQFTGHASFAGAQFTGDVSFAGAEITKASFEGAEFTGDASFDGAILDLASFQDAQFTGAASFNAAKFAVGAVFSRAQFTGDASFDGAILDLASFQDAQFTGAASFNAAKFAEGAVFSRAQFTARASFDHAQFTKDTYFNGAHFAKAASFYSAQFTGDASFDGAILDLASFQDAQFTGAASFNAAKFAIGTMFSRAKFIGHASFDHAQFTGSAFFEAQFGAASFDHAVFAEGTYFDGAVFTELAWFGWAEFRKATMLGPLTAKILRLNGAVFDCPLVIEATAEAVSCNDTTWNARVTIRLRHATVSLESANFTEPSFVTGSDRPFIRGDGRLVVDVVDVLDGDGDGDGYSNDSGLENDQLDHDAQVRQLALILGSASRERWMPKVTTLRATDASNVSFTDVDLSDCYFAGALLLDQLRLEGRYMFDHPPTGIRTGWAWPPVWRWSSRQSLAEERGWRATTPKRAGWSDPRPVEGAGVSPERLAALYRQLRKIQEDAKNEPGAADFYYGEMEMRRHSEATPRAERFILMMYWAVSGYGLRATRAFMALAFLIFGSAAVLKFAGFPGRAPAYLDSLLYVGGSVLSLSLTIGKLPAVLTHWGDAIRILLRIAGPVLLGLGALALRGRIKR